MSKKDKNNGSTQEAASSSSNDDTSGMVQINSPLGQHLSTMSLKKRDLQKLNDRLAQYIEHNRLLETERQQFSSEIKTIQEQTQKEISRVRTVCDKEIRDLRIALDDLSKNKAKTDIDVGRLKNENESLNSKLKAKQKELNTLAGKVDNHERTIEELRAKNNQLINEKRKADDNLGELNGELKNIKQSLSTCQKQLEEETYLRVNLENKLQSMKEELAFKEELHQQDVADIQSRLDTSSKSLEEQLRADEYVQRLTDELQELREENEALIRSARQELQDDYEKRLKDLNRKLEIEITGKSSASVELNQLKSQNQSLNAKIKELATQNEQLSGRVKDVEKMINQEREWSLSAIKTKDEEISKLYQKNLEIIKDHQDLVDIKLALDAEIAAYRKMLDREEQRLDISPRTGSGDSKSVSISTISTPFRRVAVPRKRKILEEREEVTNIDVLSDYKGDIQISDSDQDGKMVRLTNMSNEDVSLSGWQLQRTVGDKKLNFKFTRTTLIKGKSSLTIHSSNTKAVHNPSEGEILMKGNWPQGDQVEMILLNGEGDEVAKRTTKLLKNQTSKYRRMTGGENGAIDDEDPNKCSIM